MSLANVNVTTLTNAAGVSVDPGIVVRGAGDSTFTRAQANSVANRTGLQGIVRSTSTTPNGGRVNVATSGEVKIRLESGLSPLAGQTLYLSASSPGLATNVAPSDAVPVGVVKDAGDYSSSNPLVTATISMAGAGAGGGGALLVQPNLTALAAVDANAVADGTVVWVQTVRDMFTLDRSSTLTADGITIVTATTGRWIRHNVPDRFWRSQLTWFINADTGDDENLGSTSGAALASWAELMRRIRNNDYGPAAETLRVNIETDLAEVLHVDVTTVFSGRLEIVGVPQVLFGPSTVTAVTAQNKAANQALELTDSAIPTSWTSAGLVGKRIRRLTGGVPDRSAWVLKDQGSKTARISQVVTISETPTDFGSGESTIGLGDDYDVVDVPVVQDIFVARNNLLIVQGVGITAPSGFSQASSRGSGSFDDQFALKFCEMNSSWFTTSVGIELVLSCFKGAFDSVQFFVGTITACAFIGGTPTWQGKNIKMFLTSMFQGVRLLLDRCELDALASSLSPGDIGFFDTPSDAVIKLQRGSTLFAPRLWGSGNTGDGVKFINGYNRAQFTTTPNLSVSANEIAMLGFNGAFSDLATGELQDAEQNRIMGTGNAQVTRRTIGTIANVPILGADPSAPVDGDIWITDIGGTREFKARIGGVTYTTTLT